MSLYLSRFNNLIEFPNTVQKKRCSSWQPRRRLASGPNLVLTCNKRYLSVKGRFKVFLLFLLCVYERGPKPVK